MSAASRATSTAVATGDSHIRRMQRRSVVDAVAHVADDVSAMFEREDDAKFLHGRDARKDGGFLGHVAKRRVAHLVEFASEDGRTGFQAHLRANVLGDQLIVSRQNLHLNAIAFHGRYGSGGILGRRVGKCQKAGQDERVLVFCRESVV